MPEEECAYYGKPEWNEGGKVSGKDHYRRASSKRTVGHKDVDLDHHGVDTSCKDNWNIRCRIEPNNLSQLATPFCC